MDEGLRRYRKKIPQELRAQFEKICVGDLGGHVIFAARKVKLSNTKTLKDLGIGLGQASVLCILKIAGELNINQLADALHKDKATISRCIEALCKKDYVRKIQRPADKRMHMVSLTNQGERFMEILRARFQKVSSPLEEIFSKDDIDKFHIMLDSICDYYDNAANAPAPKRHPARS